MHNWDRIKQLLDEGLEEATVVLRQLLREGSPELKVQLALQILKIRGRSSVRALVGPDDAVDAVMAKDLAEWILVTARSDPAAYAQLRMLHAAARQRPGSGTKKRGKTDPPALTAGGDVV